MYVCMYVCMYVYIYIYIYICVCVWVYVRVCGRACVHACVNEARCKRASRFCDVHFCVKIKNYLKRDKRKRWNWRDNFKAVKGQRKATASCHTPNRVYTK